MTPQSNPQRFFRLQFSLRMLLLLMALVAISLAIFRWPWETSVVEADLTYTMRFHRGWNGKPLRHGLQSVAKTPSRQRVREAIYEDEVLRRERTFDARGELATDKVHFPARGETIEQTYGLGRESLLIAKSRIFAGGRRLQKEWRNTSNHLLEAIEYESKNDQEEWKLVRWNNRPIAEAVQELLNPLPPQQQAIWARHGWLSNQFVSSDLGDSTFWAAGALLHVDGPNENPLAGIPLGRRANYFLCPTSTTPNGPLVHELLAHAHARHQTLQCRFGILCLVPISAETAAPGDPTGTLAVQFAAGTTAAAAWLENVVGMDQDLAPAKRLQHFFRDTGIEIDSSQSGLTSEYPPSLLSGADKVLFRKPAPVFSKEAYRRTRRDTLGIFLRHHRLRVEQQGNKLIVLPRK